MSDKGQRVLVVGARPDSLGYLVAHHCRAEDFVVRTAGISGEDLLLDVTSNMRTLHKLMAENMPDHVVCTVGMNVNPENDAYQYNNETQWKDWWADHFDVNCTGPMRLLQAWLESPFSRVRGKEGHFVVIGSNSAHIARTDSAAYCASKASLSMAVRVKARELGRAGAPAVVYGYEPGLLADTPMTQETKARFGGGTFEGVRYPPLHRMLGIPPEGMSAERLAMLIAFNLRNGGRELNGCMLRIDAGEQ